MQKLLDIKITQLQMVRDRGYTINPDEEAILDMPLEKFIRYINNIVTTSRTSIRSSLSRSYVNQLQEGEPTTNRKSILVYYGGKTQPQQKQTPVEVVREFISLVQRYGVTEAILILDVPLSSTSNDELSALKLTKWQVFQDSDLTYNPTLHVDIPKHELIPKDQADTILRNMKTDYLNSILIKVTDPVVRYYGWTSGSLIRIYRVDSSISILSPESINYRVVTG